MNISVVIPAYNEQKYIGACLDSIFAQTKKAHEIIVVDNNSTDDTTKIVKKYPDVLLMHEPRQATVYARDTGFNHATGEVIARIDADCIASADWLHNIEKILEDKSVDAVTGAVEHYDLPKKTSKEFLKLHRLIERNIGYPLTLGANLALCASLWKKISANVCDNEDPYMFEDTDLGIHIHLEGGNAMISPAITVDTTARRFKKNPLEILVDYPKRIIYTLNKHKVPNTLKLSDFYKALLPRST